MQLVAVLGGRTAAGAPLLETVGAKRLPAWRDLLHDLSKRSRLLHVAHPFSAMLSTFKVFLLITHRYCHGLLG
jgi:hypothetical protein